MPRFIIVGCTHGQYRNLALPWGDVLVHTGDSTAYSDEGSVRDFLMWLEAQPHTSKVYISGNHATFEEANWQRFAQLRAEHAPTCTYLEDSSTEIEGLRVWGSPYSPRFMDWAFNVDRGPAIQRHWDLIPSDTQVLITHGPPMGILDWVPGDVFNPGGKHHVGCANLRTTIDERLDDLRLHAFSHVHYAAGRDRIGDKTFINASMVNEAYHLVNAPVMVDL